MSDYSKQIEEMNSRPEAPQPAVAHDFDCTEPTLDSIERDAREMVEALISHHKHNEEEARYEGFPEIAEYYYQLRRKYEAELESFDS